MSRHQSCSTLRYAARPTDHSVRRPKLSVWLLLVTLLSIAGSTGRTSAQAGDFDLATALAAAAPGATIQVPPGIYAGPLEINAPVTLIGDGEAIIQGTGKGDVITVNAADVTLRGLIIRNSGDLLDQENAGITGLAPRLTVEENRLEDTLFGIYLKEAPDSIIRNNVVYGKQLAVARRGDGIRVWYSDNTLIEKNHVIDSRDVVIWFSPHSVIRGNTVEGGRYGLHFMFSDDQLVEENILRHNSVGAYLMYGRNLVMRNNLFYANHGPSGYGVGLKDVDDVVATGNRSVANRIGVYIDNSPREPDATVDFSHNVMAYNEIGLEVLPLVKRNTYSQNLFVENGEQVSISGGGVLSDNNWSAGGLGNYWSDYRGFDADGDGVGDIAYAPSSLYESLLANHPALRLFQMSPASEALDLAARAFPLFEPRQKIRDEQPLVTAPAAPVVRGLPAAPRRENLLVATLLLAIAGLILSNVAMARRRRTQRLRGLIAGG